MRTPATSEIFVPCPASVNSSSSSECGTRPSTMCAEPTPARTESRHASSFGRIPPPTPPRAACTSVTEVFRDERLRIRRIPQPARDIGEEHHLVGLQRLGDSAGGGVRVDVVGVAGASAPTLAITGM